eukprot:g5219.t1
MAEQRARVRAFVRGNQHKEARPVHRVKPRSDKVTALEGGGTFTIHESGLATFSRLPRLPCAAGAPKRPRALANARRTERRIGAKARARMTAKRTVAARAAGPQKQTDHNVSKYPVIGGTVSSEYEMAARLERRTASRMRKNRHRLRKRCMTRIDRIGGLRKAFDTFDTDGNGTLDREEVKQLMDQLKIGKVGDDRSFFTGELDTNGDGLVDFDEFASWITRIDRVPRNQDLKLKRIWELTQMLRKQGAAEEQRARRRACEKRQEGKERKGELKDQKEWRRAHKTTIVAFAKQTPLNPKKRAMASTKIKMEYEGEMRRTERHAGEMLEFRTLADLARSLFGAKLRANGCAVDALHFTYLDDEQDVVTVTSDGELREAARIAVDEARKSLKLAVICDAPVVHEGTSTRAPGGQPAVHHGILCDPCADNEAKSEVRRDKQMRLLAR